jgi:hypothetical protein
MKNLLILFIALSSVQANANDAKPARRFFTKNYLGLVAGQNLAALPAGLTYSMQVESIGSSNVGGFSVILAKDWNNETDDHNFAVFPSIYVGRKINSSVSIGILGGVSAQGQLNLLLNKNEWSKKFMGGVYIALDIYEGKYRVSFSVQAIKESRDQAGNLAITYLPTLSVTAFLG